MLEYSRNLKEPSRKLRTGMTDAERVLWSRLRGKQLLDAQFYRQKPLGPFIVDFYCHAAALVLEVDGGQHYEAEHARKDAERDKYLADAGLLVMRFDNRQVLQETDAVVEEILRVMHERQIPPSPPLQSGVTANLPLSPFQKGGENKSPFRKGDKGVGDGLKSPFRKGDLGGISHHALCPGALRLLPPPVRPDPSGAGLG